MLAGWLDSLPVRIGVSIALGLQGAFEGACTEGERLPPIGGIMVGRKN